MRVDLTDLFPLTIPVQVIDIHDGDTMTVRSGRRMMRVRLSRIDAPELSQKFHQSKMNAGFPARDCVRKLVPAETVLSIQGFDLYHRTLGDIGGINYLAVKNGCAGIYPHARFSSVNEKMEFLRALNEAKKNRRGVWGHGCYMIPKKYRKISKRGEHPQWHRRLHSRATYPPGRRSG
ncbi:MAG: thermonuclease family protein [Bacteriovoracaceae bacterium]